MKSIDYRALATDAATFVQKTGALLARHQARAKIRGYKDVADIVTSADLASEKLLVSLIQKKYPTHSIDSEEMDAQKVRWKQLLLDSTLRSAITLKHKNHTP